MPEGAVARGCDDAPHTNPQRHGLLLYRFRFRFSLEFPFPRCVRCPERAGGFCFCEGQGAARTGGRSRQLLVISRQLSAITLIASLRFTTD